MKEVTLFIYNLTLGRGCASHETSHETEPSLKQAWIIISRSSSPIIRENLQLVINEPVEFEK